MNSANIVDALIKDIKERLTLDGKNRVFNEGEKLRSEFMKETAEPEAFTREFLIDKIFSAFELEKLSEKKIEDSRGLRSVDYRIKSKRGVFLVEAKPLNADLFEKSREGGVNQTKGLFRLAEVKENYAFGVATNGLRWVFIDRTGKIVDDLRLEDDFAQIHEFLVGKEKVVSPKTEEEISKKFYDWYNALLHGGRYKNHENKQKTVAEADCLVNNIVGVKDLEEREQIAQVVMNRLIFVKFLQSKGIIGEDILKYLSEVKEDLLTPKLRQLFFGSLDRPKAERFDIDERFKDIPYLNGSLFVHTEVERKNIDYKVRAEILKTILQFLDSFKFVHKEQLGNGDSVDPEILGYIFERAMTATDRKGTGAYYTPKSITKYISENTIYPCIIEKTNEILKTEKGYKDTELIKDIDELFILPATTLKEIWDKIILKLRVLDNACGSGAFLLAAANILFELNKKINDKLGAENPDTTLKILILVNNLYGVDINPNGIEIAKLRLWLWLADSYEPGYIKPLPNIDYNLRVGNSLIGYVDLGEFKGAKLTLSDFLRDEEKPTLDCLLKERNDLIREYKISWGEEAKELKESVQELDVKISNLLNSYLYRKFRKKKIKISREEFLRLNPFHWGFEFYEVFDAEKSKEERGFDVVMGNPPYVRQEALGELKTYFQDYYKVYQGTADLYVYFIERGFSLLTDGGVFSYIVANKWMRANYGKPLRQWLKQQRIEEIVDFGDLPVFQVTTYPCIIRISKNTPELDLNVTQVKTLEFTSLDDYVKDNKYVVKQEGLDDSGWSLADEKTQALLDKIRHVGRQLGEYVNGKIYRGVLTGFNNAFVIDADTRGKLIAEDAKSEELIKPFLVGRDIKRYHPLKSERYLIFTRRGIDIQQYPAIKRHLLQFKERLMPKPKDWKGEKWQGRKPGSYEWYEIQDTVDYYAEFEKPKIIIPAIVKKASYVLDRKCFYSNDKTSIISSDDLYLLGILNSKVLDFVIHSISSTKRGGYFEYKPMYVQQLPIRTVNFSNLEDKARHDGMVDLVEQMLGLHERLAKTTTETDKAMLQRQIDSTDQEIDNLVYELYELTDEEIAIVERSSK